MTVITRIKTKRHRDTVIRYYESGSRWRWSFNFIKEEEAVHGNAPSEILAIRQAMDVINERYNQLNFG